MKSKSCKAKGRRLQQEVRDALRVIAERVAPGQLKPDDIESREMGQKGVDVRFSPAGKALLNLCIECKNMERLNVPKVFKKHFDQYCKTDPESLKLLFHSRNHCETLVTLRAEDFFAMLEDYHTLKP